MREFLLAFIVLAFITGCGSSSDDAVPVSNTENVEAREDLAAVEVACHVFSPQHNADAVSFQEAFPSLYQDCQDQVEINEEQSSAVMESYSMAFEVLSSFDKEAHKSCVPTMKRVMKTVYQMARRDQKEVNDKRAKQQELAKGSLDNHLRRLIARGCLVDFDALTYGGEQEKTFEFGSNHLRNGSFEIIKDLESNQFTELGRQWMLAPNKKVPAWKVKAMNPQEGKECALLEVQGEGVTTTVPAGSHIVELDGHCKNENGSNTSGDARVAISQSFHVKAPGSYKVTMKAQKRGGDHGELQVAAFQRSRDKEFVSTQLSDTAEWNDVCVDVEIVEAERSVKLVIQDGDADGRSTYGLLLDDVSFEEGSCL